MATKIKYNEKNSISYITLYEENEKHPITLDWNSIAELENTITTISKNKNIRAVVLKSDSPKSFAVGANIAVLETLDEINVIDWVKNGHRVFDMFQELKVPVIAKVENYCMGGGLELAMSCDMIICTENARFAQPEASLGFMPGWGGSYRLSNLIGPARAKEMFYSGEQIDAKTAYEWGLVNHVFPKEMIDEEINKILIKIMNNDAKVLWLTKEIINGHTQPDTEKNTLEEAYTSSVCMTSESTRQRLRAFFESRKK